MDEYESLSQTKWDCKVSVRPLKGDPARSETLCISGSFLRRSWEVSSVPEPQGTLKRQVSAGVDGVTWSLLPERIPKLHQEIHTGAYRKLPSRQVYIPKADGRQRPLGIASIADKVVQQAVNTVLGTIYEEDLLGFSYDFAKVAASTMRWTR